MEKLLRGVPNLCRSEVALRFGLANLDRSISPGRKEVDSILSFAVNAELRTVRHTGLGIQEVSAQCLELQSWQAVQLGKIAASDGGWHLLLIPGHWTTP